MANEITHNYTTGLTLYFCCFQPDGDVFLTGGASDEVWGTGARTAADYDEAMVEEATSGHYKGSMTVAVAGVYQIAVYLQAGANPVDADIVIAQGEIYWDGSAEISLSTSAASIALILADTNEIQGKLPDDYIMGSSVTTSMDDEINAIVGNLGQVHTTEDESPGGVSGAAGTSGIAEGC